MAVRSRRAALGAEAARRVARRAAAASPPSAALRERTAIYDASSPRQEDAPRIEARWHSPRKGRGGPGVAAPRPVPPSSPRSPQPPASFLSVATGDRGDSDGRRRTTVGDVLTIRPEEGGTIDHRAGCDTGEEEARTPAEEYDLRFVRY